MCLYFRIFTPDGPADVTAVEERARTEYASDNEKLIQTGIRTVSTGNGNYGWFWGSGMEVVAPWWCGTQPNNAAGEPILLLDPQSDPPCFHDAPVNHLSAVLCKEGKPP